jgi:hypothetical protein
MADEATATLLQIFGAFFFGMLLGWYLYYINRYRKEEIKLNDLITLIGALGGATVLALFPAKSDLFGAYGIGLAIGFFGYFAVLVICVHFSGGKFNSTWFLDGRKMVDDKTWVVPGWTKMADGTIVQDNQKPMGVITTAGMQGGAVTTPQGPQVLVPGEPEKTEKV